jgi:hypothetical protein
MGKSLWSPTPGGVLFAKCVDLVVAARSGDELDSLSTEIFSHKSPQEPYFIPSSYSGFSAGSHFHSTVVQV